MCVFHFVNKLILKRHDVIQTKTITRRERRLRERITHEPAVHSWQSLSHTLEQVTPLHTPCTYTLAAIEAYKYLFLCANTCTRTSKTSKHSMAFNCLKKNQHIYQHETNLFPVYLERCGTNSLTPWRQACSLSALTHARWQCSLNDRKVKSEERRPLTPAPEPPRPSRYLSSKPHTPPVSVWWVRRRGSCHVVSLFCAALPPLLDRSKACENWTSHVSTTRSETQKSATRTGQLTSSKSIVSPDHLGPIFNMGWKGWVINVGACEEKTEGVMECSVFKKSNIEHVEADYLGHWMSNIWGIIH